MPITPIHTSTMKHIIATLLLMVALVALSSCDKSSAPDGPNTGHTHLFDRTYQINSDGYCVLQDMQPIASSHIDSEVKGYGWKVANIYAVTDNGRLASHDYRTYMSAVGYDDYWFKPDGKLVCLHHGDTPGNYYYTTTWNYDSERGFLLRYDADEDMQNRYMQVLQLSTPSGQPAQMYTIQKLASTVSPSGATHTTYGMIVYQRMTDEELAKALKRYYYDADRDNSNAVPNSCKFRVTARYANPDEFEDATNGAVIVAGGKVTFSLTDHLGSTILPNPALDFFDSIVWVSNSRYLPDSYVIHRHQQGSAQSVLTWSTYFLYKDPRLTTTFQGYKNGRVVYTYEMKHDIYVDQFLCYDWSSHRSTHPKEHVIGCLLDRERNFTVYEPRIYNGDEHKVYAELRYNSEKKGEGNDIAILQKEENRLVFLITNYYGNGQDVDPKDEHYRSLFYALPDKADLKLYWETASTRIALVRHHDELQAQNNYYYIHAEPKH